MAFAAAKHAKLYSLSNAEMKSRKQLGVKILRRSALFLFAMLVVPTTAMARPQDCKAPEPICKAAANQDRSLYVRDHSRYEQKIRIERFKIKNGTEQMEEVRDTSVMVEPAAQADKTGRVPVVVTVTADTDKKGNPKSNVKQDEKTLLSFGAVWDLAFFPLLPEKVRNYTFQELIAERKGERWFRFVPKPEITMEALASGVVQLDAKTSEVLTIRIEGLHNVEVLDKEAAKLRSFRATIDYSQFEGALRMPTLASGSGESNVRRFEGNFRFRFEEGRYRIIRKIE